MIKKDLTTRKEAVVTISNGELHAVVWTDKNKRKVFYKCEPMDESELVDLLQGTDETVPRMAYEGLADDNIQLI